MERERVVDHEPTQRQLDVLYKEPEAREVFDSLSAPVQHYLHLNWLSANPTLSKDERKDLRAQVQSMATQMFGEQNIDKGYNEEMKRYGNAVWMEIWQEEREGS